MDPKIKVATPQEQINSCLASRENFLLSGGAGSGKTHSLIDTLRAIFDMSLTSKVACITFTNVAVDEIKERAPYSNLWVSTIHEFLWNEIKPFQKNLKSIFIEQFNTDGEINMEEISSISYDNYRNLSKGVISHNDLINIASEMFSKHPKLAKIISDKYDYLLIDEYQDTNPAVIKIVLSDIEPYAAGKLCIGMFGDRMQSIYDDGVESKNGLDIYRDKFRAIIKQDNYRCSQRVIGLLNKIRADDVQQEPSNKTADGVVKNLVGSARFIYSNNELNLKSFKVSPLTRDWDFTDPKKTKVLMLTHNLIAQHSDFGDIISAYKNCEKTKTWAIDNLLGNTPDRLAALLLRICSLIHMFEDRNYRALLSKIDLKIKNNDDKKIVAELLSELSSSHEMVIGEILDKLNHTGIVISKEIIDRYSAEEYGNLLAEISAIPLRKMRSYYDYYNGFLPFSTQHGVKGAEHDNVLVILDNGKWNKYNFKYLFENMAGKTDSIERTRERTRKIFYVCCSRAQDNLIVFMKDPTPQTIARANELFGTENVINLDEHPE